MSNVTATDATLEAQIDSGGLETSYQFRLESGCPIAGLSCMAIAVYPLPAGSMPASSEVQNVSLDLNDAGVTLHPGTKYRYSVEATNSARPPVKGPDQIFTTPSSSPVIGSESATAITETDATLNAVINANGAPTAYEFQIDTNSSYDYTQPACPFGPCEAIIVGEPLPPGLVEPLPESIPAGSGDQMVSLDLASIGATLQPGTTYHYRVIASNGGPIVTDPDQTFTTLSSGAAPLGQPLDALTLPASSPAINPAPSVSHLRRGKHKRHRHHRDNGSARSTRTVRR